MSAEKPENGKSDYKGYSIVVGRHFHHGGEAHYTITRPKAGADHEIIYQGICEGSFDGADDADDRAFAAAYRDARAYIDKHLPALT